MKLHMRFRHAIGSAFICREIDEGRIFETATRSRREPRAAIQKDSFAICSDTPERALPAQNEPSARSGATQGKKGSTKL